jgi:mono/diheme cytochrome c family protein
MASPTGFRRILRSVAIAGIGVAGALVGMAAALTTPQGSESTPTFDKDIAPIIFDHCASCHRPGQEAPFSLLNYSDVKSHAQIIVATISNRFMPPWKPVVGYGDLAGVRALTDQQIAMIRDWVKQGAVEGNPRDLPPTPHFSSEWVLGQPDLVIKFPKPFAVPAGGPDLYHCFIVPVNIPEDRYVTAFDFRPIPPNVVHHVIVVLDPFGAARHLESAPGDGYSCYGGFSFPVPGYLGIWTAGAVPKPEPKGVAKVVKKGSDLVIQMHFHPSGRPESELPSIGLYFQKERPQEIPFDMTLGSVDINIPPGDKHYRVTDYAYVMQNVDLIGIIPHAHKLCREIKAYATMPDGKVTPLLWIKDWDFNWQEQYRYNKPILLPQGTRIDAEWIYDNSADNPRNPNNPPQRVTWGEGTNDEMAELHLELIAAEPPAQPTSSAPARCERRGPSKLPPRDGFQMPHGFTSRNSRTGGVSDLLPTLERTGHLKIQGPAKFSLAASARTRRLSSGSCDASTSARWIGYILSISRAIGYQDLTFSLTRIATVVIYYSAS